MKPPVKNTLLTALWWLMLWLASFFSFLLMFSLVHCTNDSDGAGFMPIWLYAVNPVCYCAGAVLSIAAFVLIRRFLRQTVPFGRGWHPVWAVLWVILALLGLFGVFVIFLIVLLMKTGLFSRLDPQILENFGIVYPIAAAIVILIDCIRAVRGKREG